MAGRNRLAVARPAIRVADRLDAATLRALPAAAGNDESDAPWSEQRQALTTLLVRQTLEHAASSVPFYGHQGWHPEEFDRLSDLGRLVPVTRKRDIVAAPQSFISTVELPDSFHCTSGTTGRRLTVYRNTAEAEAFAELLRLRTGARLDAPEIALRLFPNTLRLFAPPSRVASTAYNLVVNFSLTQTHHQWFDNTDHLIEVLGQDYLLGGVPRRISMLHATPPYLMDFVTRQLLVRGVDPRRFGLRGVAVSGGFTSSAVRRTIERAWGAPFVTAYSCTEIRGEAMELVDSPGTYLPGPTLHAEICDFETGEPVEDGECGEVLLTSLVPFQTVMPLLRYRTGDVAQRVPLPGHEGRTPFALRLLGRHSHGVVEGARGFIGSRDVLEAVADLDEVPQFPYARHRLRRDAGEVVVDVECTEVPWRSRTHLARRIAERLAGQLRERGMTPPALRAVPVLKGELEGHARLYPDR